MRLIVGLGNPGRKYSRTRHNIGFLCLDAFASQHKLRFKKQKKMNGRTAFFEDAVLLKPETYMNLSGISVEKVASYYDIAPEDILVIHDDMALETGSLRLRYKGSSGGHKGVASIIEQLSTPLFNRVRFGIGDPGDIPPKAYVLKHFFKEEGDVVIEGISAVKDIIESFARGERFVTLMNTYN